MEINYLGHATVELVEGDVRILIDPFLKPNNPAAELTAEDVNPTHVLMTHAHADHSADAVAVGKRTGASFVAQSELANVLQEQGLDDVADPNLGGTVECEWGWVKLVQAFHSSTFPGSEDAPFSPTPGTVTGPAAGLVVNFAGKTLYHLGDTCLFGDLRLIAERTPVDIAFIPIGGHYTMDRHDAVVAADFVGADTVIPVHYNTFPPIETDAEAFRSDVESQTKSKVVVLKPGESHSV
ncbi:MAG TPA: metal-dependent hydrolase [Solirubrobacterales bacterium]|nr:metal-dependent hydrolase [Solirubrobacterales bacterium]